MKFDHCWVKHFVCLMYNCTDLNICAFCSSDKLSSPNSKVSISKLSRNCRLFVKCSRASTYKQHSRKKWIASSITHPHTQPGSLIKFTLKRSAFKLINLRKKFLFGIILNYSDVIVYLHNQNQIKINKNNWLSTLKGMLKFRK